MIPPPPQDYPYYWVLLDPKSKEDKVKVTNLKNSPKFQFFKFWNKHYTKHTFSSCLQIWNGSNKYCWRYRADTILSTDGQRDRGTEGQTDGQTDKVIPVYPPFNFVEAGGIIMSADGLMKTPHTRLAITGKLSGVFSEYCGKKWWLLRD